jgi:hypothetical protein
MQRSVNNQPLCSKRYEATLTNQHYLCSTTYTTAIRPDLANATDAEDGNMASLYADISRGIENRLGAFEAHLYR